MIPCPSSWNTVMLAQPEENPQPENDRLEAAADEAIEACGGDMRSAIRALILANEYLEYELQTKVSQGYMRGVKHGRFDTHSG
jgi:hypothetical protein